MIMCAFLPLQYMSNVDSWCKACGEVDLPSELQDLEDAIHHHQGLYEHITAAYSEVTFFTVLSRSNQIKGMRSNSNETSKQNHELLYTVSVVCNL